jgi:hypothetical protein
MRSYYTFIALELARQRAAEANAQRLFAHPGEPRTAGLRRVIARIALAVARAADAAAADAPAADAEVARVPLGDAMSRLDWAGRHRS